MDDELSKARWERGAESRYMTHKDNWVMVRRPGCIPYVMFKRDWLALPLAADGERMSNEYAAALNPQTSQ